MPSNSNSLDFVAGGCERAGEALEPEVRRQVEDEFADEWNRCGDVRRWFLRRKIKAEIARRLKELAPPGALY
jgi:hypothetical protein